MIDDHQVRRFREARLRHHEAMQVHRETTRELEAAATEVVVAGADLAERVLLLDPHTPIKENKPHAHR